MCFKSRDGIIAIMNYGLKVFSKLGNVLLDTTYRIARFIWKSSSTSSSGSQVLDGTSGTINISSLKTVQFSLPVDLPVPTYYLDQYCTPYVTRSGTTIAWTQNLGTWYQAGSAVIFVFAYT